ncbi:aminotransferase class I/II-fold pyridoxal phosphate-dependent enzyme [Vibrio ruber]|uniref:aminotransferase class I/II-fold pyridoxal phosphate-dependent enzyme n=1 Tax=Vibrio ruber TaxID=184755 RepID=UPI002892AA3C|nr:aminotransferase class I/II-fold pyridoxal phosphate-dependent enzyme [Vibrio ruber]WNJ97289.1 aminotransferase class I/II-fold pyridoxal phosphate-dependent enzyme [Vibrio ruber]
MAGRAIDSYNRIKLQDTEQELNLSWTVDERSLVQPDMESLVNGCLLDELKNNLDATMHYAVDDPWGSALLTSSVANYFSLPEHAISVNSGAGVNSLLSFLANLPQACRVAILPPAYPDFPWWLCQRSQSVFAIEPTKSITGQVLNNHASLLFFERPSLFNDPIPSLLSLTRLCNQLAKHRVLVVIDESNANYCSPSYSAASLVTDCPNLIVLRGLSKGWGLGGIRVGFCLSGKALEIKLRQVIPPLQTPFLSLKIAETILRQGDSTAPLRSRIQHCKALIRPRLKTFSPVEANEPFPYFFFNTNRNDLLLQHKIRGKHHMCWWGNTEPQSILRISVPLSETRFSRFLSLLPLTSVN